MNSPFLNPCRFACSVPCGALAASLVISLAFATKAGAQDGTWITPTGGAWATAANWADSIVPGGSGTTAFFNNLDLTANATVALNGNRTIGALVFGDPVPSHGWSIIPGSSGTLTLGFPAVVNVANQTATISAPLAGSDGLRKDGAGTLVLAAASTMLGDTHVNEGTLELAYQSTAAAGGRGTLRGTIRIWPGATLHTSAGTALGYGVTWVNAIHLTGGAFNNTAADQDQGWGVAYHLTGGTMSSIGSGTRFSAGGGTSVTTYASAAPSAINGEFRLREGNTSERVAFTIERGSSHPDLRVNGPITTTAATRGIEKGGKGQMEIAGACTYTGPTLVNEGDLMVTGSLANTTVTVASGAVLSGTGTVAGPTTVNGTLAPGSDGIGTLRVTNTLKLALMTEMEIFKSGGALGNDAIQGITTLTHGGTLRVSVRQGSEQLAPGDSFTLFSATSRSGAFAAIVLPVLPAPLRWDSGQLHSQGRLTVSTGTQTIDFPHLPDLVAGDPPLNLAGTATSGLPVTFTSSDPAVAAINGVVLTAVSVGTVTITASQGGDAAWGAATPVARQVRVWPAAKTPQTITFVEPADPVYGGPPVALAASANSGLPVGFTSSDPGVAVVENGLLVARFPGTATLTASQPGNHEFAAAMPVAHEITVSGGTVLLPQAVRRTAAHDSAPITVDVPVASASGDVIPWTAAAPGYPVWLRVLTPTGGTPGVLRLELMPSSGIAPGTHRIIVVVNTGDGSFPLPVHLTVESSAAFEAFHFTSADTVPVTAGGYDASGKLAFVSLAFAPPPGTELTLVRNSGAQPISGVFANLLHGSVLQVPFDGVPYPFVANYYGGDGNDLVLHWANSRLVAWGSRFDGQLGTGTVVNDSPSPAAVVATGVLAGKTILAIRAGGTHNLALCADGALAAWGSSSHGQLGDGGQFFSRSVPVLVNRSGVLKDKTITSIAAGLNFSFAVCADGTLVSWGSNSDGQLGIGSDSPAGTSTPQLAGGRGALAGKAVIRVAAGASFAVALCADGTLAAWGSNGAGELGNGTFHPSTSPVPVDCGGVLAGKTIVQIAAGNNTAMALCSDGTLAAWGAGSSGQLGNGTTVASNVPVLVTRSTALADKTVIRIAAGTLHHLALCADGTLAAWGAGSSGQLGNGTTTHSAVPVAVTRTGALAGKTITGISGGNNHSIVVCSDGTIRSWGDNSRGQLGNFSYTRSTTPVAAGTGGAAAGGRFTAAMAGGNSHAVGLVALPPVPTAVTLAATGVLDEGATLNGEINAAGSGTTIWFEYGPTAGYGSILSAQPASDNGVASTAASATLTGLIPETTYHYRIVAHSDGGTARGAAATFTTSGLASLASLEIDHGNFGPAFHPLRTSYEVVVSHETDAIRLTATPRHADATVIVDGDPVQAGVPSSPIALGADGKTINIAVSAPDGVNSRRYTVRVVRLPEILTFGSASTVPLTVSELPPTGLDVRLALAFAPPPGTTLKLVNNTGYSPLAGAFANLTQGQTIHMAFNGISYPFIVHHSGGDGNDLVLLWANTRPIAWGDNRSRQLGDTTTTSRFTPVAVELGGALAGKAIIAFSAGSDIAGNRCHTLALCADGTLVAWGSNIYGQLGDNSTTSRTIPVAVEHGGALAGKTVAAIASGANHNLALCSDGTLVAWGYNLRGQLGSGPYTFRSTPERVNTAGVLKGKTVTAIAAGFSHSLALCSDGTLAAWGENIYGALGNGTTTGGGEFPVAVDLTGALAGKTITAIAAGGYHNLALCSDGTLVAWGDSSNGQLGIGSAAVYRTFPVVVATGALVGKTVTGIAAGLSHSVALCADGTLATWGSNANGQLGNPISTRASTPVIANTTGVLAGKTITALMPGDAHTLVLTADGSVAAWGDNTNGRLGTGAAAASFNATPALVSTSSFGPGERIMALHGGPTAAHSLALVATPPPPHVTTFAASAVTDSTATFNASVNPNGADTTVAIDYGPTTAYGSTLAAGALTGSGPSQVAATATELLPGTTYHFRIRATSVYGVTLSEDQTFVTSASATLASVALSTGSLSPAFAPTLFSYAAMVPADVDALVVTAVATRQDATLAINGVTTPSGSPTSPIPLAPGPNAILLATTSGDGASALSYTVTVTRIPASFVFDSATAVPAASAVVELSGHASVSLGFAPEPGTRLTLVNNTGANPITGSLANLVHGQLVQLTHDGMVYPFVANYYGNDGNDLVLQWANNRLFAWGDNGNGQLGNGTAYARATPVAVDPAAFGGRAILAHVSRGNRCLALCADGTLFQWGREVLGDFKTFSARSSTLPVPVARVAPFADQRVTAIASGERHFLVLAADGTLAAWGSNTASQLGNASAAYNGDSSPMLVDRSGVLNGQTVMAIACGSYHNLVLCADGTLAAWGENYSGQLGIVNTVTNGLPALVNRAGALVGKTVTAIAAGGYHNLALCSDGTLAAWGANGSGQLGNNSTTASAMPVAVDRGGALAGKTIIAIAAGHNHNLALCSDGTLAAWGDNSQGALGNNSTTHSSVPVAVIRSGALAGKTLAAIAAGQNFSLAVCGDGTLTAWGNNGSGQLGNGTNTQSTVPVVVNATALGTGERFVAATAGFSHGLALTALPPSPAAATLAATAATDTSATLRATVSARNSTTTVTFEFGATTAYGRTASANPVTAAGNTPTTVSADLSGLTPGVTYHFRAVAASAGGVTYGEDVTFTTTALARLASLVPDSGSLSPAFHPDTVTYLATVPFETAAITLTPTAEIETTTIAINGAATASGSPATPVPLAPGPNTIQVSTTAAGGVIAIDYTIVFTRLPEIFRFDSAAAVPLTVPGLAADGRQIRLALGFAPPPGTDLTVVNNTSAAPIRGHFANLAHGQGAALDFDGETHLFVADYFGGTGNDLVLRWSNVRAFAWGSNFYGQVGDGTSTSRLVPVPVDASGVLAGRTIHTLARGSEHCVVACADGTLAAWGNNISGLLGTGSSLSTGAKSPVMVSIPAFLAGRQVTALAANNNHTLALCLDGTLAAWGSNSKGQLGTGSPFSASEPVPVNQSGALAGKIVTGIAAGNFHSLALCTDGSLMAWGENSSGQFGNGTFTNSDHPLQVQPTGALAGKTITAIAAGTSHSLALCSDGTLAAWGGNTHGQLGDGTLTSSSIPVAVNHSGALAGKTVTAIATAYDRNLVLCSDGTLAAWGLGTSGSLGNGSTSSSNLPVPVNQSGVLNGKTVTAISAFSHTSGALCSDGTLAGWGESPGDGSSSSAIPVLVGTANLPAGARFSRLASGRQLALVAEPFRPLTPAIADGATVVGTTQTLAWRDAPLASSFRVFFGTDPAAVASATTDSPEFLGATAHPSWPNPPMPTAGITYYWRIDTSYAIGSRCGAVWSFRVAPIAMATSARHTLVKGMADATVEVPVTSLMPDEQPWSVSASQLPPWLTLPAATGTTPQPLQLRFSPGTLATGNYQTTLTVTSGNASFDVTVAFSLVALDITKLIAHPTRPVVYGINKSSSVENTARLVEIDATTGTMLRTLPAGPGPSDADIDPVTDRLFIPNVVASVHTGTTVVDLTAWSVVGTLPLDAEDPKLEALSTGRLLTAGGKPTVSANLWDANTGDKLATLGGIRSGDCETDPTGRYLYLSDTAWPSRISMWDLSGDSFQFLRDSPAVGQGSSDLVLSGDGSRLFWQSRSYEAGTLAPIARFGGTVHASDSMGRIAIGQSAVWWADSGITAAALPFASSIAAVSANDSHLVRFNSATMTLSTTPLADLTNLPGPQPRGGQTLATSPQRLSWTPVDGAAGYRLFLAPDGAPPQWLTEPAATVAEPWYDLPTMLAPGTVYHWRVDAVTASGATLTGAIRSFSIRFADGPAMTSQAVLSSYSGKLGPGVALTHGTLALGDSPMSRFHDFDPVTGASVPRFDLPTSSGLTGFALDGRVAAMAYPTYATGSVTVGAVRLYRRHPAGHWLEDPPLTLPSPATSDRLGTGFAISGNLLLAGTGNSGTTSFGRVGCWITEPASTLVQVFAAADSVAGDGFGDGIVLEGNHAVISAPGRGAASNRVGCLYAFDRSTTTGKWTQSQKIPIPGAAADGKSGKALAISGNLLATTNGSQSVIIHTRDPAGQWLPSGSISRASVGGSSSSFGSRLAISGDLLLIGDPYATQFSQPGGAVYVFQRSGSTWSQRATITPVKESPLETYLSFGSAMSVRDGWLAVSGFDLPDPENTSSSVAYREAWLFRVEPLAGHAPAFLPGIPSQAVAGRALEATIRATDPDGAAGLEIEMLQGPAWLSLTDHGEGTATLSGTPTGSPGDGYEVQLRVTDGASPAAYHAFVLTLVAAGDVPQLAPLPAAATVISGAEFTLTAHATGASPLQWQWYCNDEPVPGATAPAFRITEVSSSDAGRYQVTVSNVAGSATSNATVLSVPSAGLDGGNWPTLGGSNSHNGRHVAALGEHSFVPAWSQPLVTDGRFIHRAAIADGRVVVTPEASESAPGEVVAITLASGEEQWRSPITAGFSYSAPTIANGRVYFQRIRHVYDCQLFALDAATGVEQWAVPFGAREQFYEAPAADESGIYFFGGPQGSESIGTHALNPDGTKRFLTSGYPRDGMAPTLHHGSLLTFSSTSFTERDAATGTTLWSVSEIGHTAVVAAQGDTVILLASNMLTCVDLDLRTVRWNIAGSFAERPAVGVGRAFCIRNNTIRSYALADGSPSTVYQGVENFIGQPVILNDRLIAAGQTKTLVFDLTTGELLQTLAAGGLLSYSNGYLLIAGSDGTLRAFLATALPELVLEVAGAEVVNGGATDFGGPPEGATVAKEFTIRNTGAAELSGIVLTISGAGAADYEITAAPPATVPPGASATFTVAFTPSIPGTRRAVLRILSNDAQRSPFDVFLSREANRAPAFSGYAAATPYRTPSTIGLRKLLSKASDPDGDTVSVTAAGVASANGGTVTLLADSIRYMPPNGFSGVDTFTVVLTDSGGAAVTGMVTVQVGQAPHAGDVGSNPPALTLLPGGKIGISFQGIPGRTYTVQRSVGGLGDWETLATVSADTAGKVSFTDESPPPGSAFYRLGLP